MRTVVRLLLGFCLASWVAACGPSQSYEPTYENVEAVVVRSCGAASNSCHGGAGRGNARLHFGRHLTAGDPITTEIVGVDSCEYDLMKIVEPGNPDNSWLMIKLDHAFDEEGNIAGFEPDPNWDHGLTPRTDGSLPPSECPMTEDGVLSFGTNMPQQVGPPDPLPEVAIEMFREWIRLGAPGPGESDAE